jgi:hypothetical protein
MSGAGAVVASHLTGTTEAMASRFGESTQVSRATTGGGLT